MSDIGMDGRHIKSYNFRFGCEKLKSAKRTKEQAR
jgi:hypothetical protein